MSGIPIPVPLRLTVSRRSPTVGALMMTEDDGELNTRLKELEAEMKKVIELQRRAELRWLIAEHERIAKRIELLTSILDASATELAPAS